MGPLANPTGSSGTSTWAADSQQYFNNVIEERCDPNEVIAGMADGVFLCLCSFIPVTNILSLRLLCKSANDRFSRDHYGWAVLLQLSGLKPYVSSATAALKLIQSIPEPRLSFKSILFRWMVHERMWTRRNYSYQSTLKLTDNVKVSDHYNIIRLHSLSDHIDRGGCRASTESELRLGGNYQHMWRICRKLNHLIQDEPPPCSAIRMPLILSCPTHGVKERNLLLYTLSNAKRDNTPAPEPCFTSPVLSCSRISIPSSSLGRYPFGYSELRHPTVGTKGDISTWATYVDLRPKCATSIARYSKGPEFPAALAVHWDTVGVENTVSEYFTAYRSYGRVSVHLINAEGPISKIASPTAVFWFLLNDSAFAANKNPYITSTSALGVIEPDSNGSWIIAAGTSLGTVHLAVSAPTSLCPVVSHGSPEIVSEQVKLLSLPRAIEEIRLSVGEHLNLDGRSHVQNLVGMNRSITLYVLGERGYLRILSAQLPSDRQTRLDELLCARWECLFSIDAKYLNLMSHWSPPMRQLLVSFKPDANDDRLSDSYCFLITAVNPELTYQCVSIEFENNKTRDCEVRMVIPADKGGNIDHAGSSVRLTLAKMGRWVTKLSGFPLREVYPAAFLGCWIIVMRNHLKIISIARGRKRKKLSWQTKGQLLGHQVPIYLCAFDGFHRFASIDLNGELFVWDIARCRRLFKLHVLEAGTHPQDVRPNTDTSLNDDSLDSDTISDRLSEGDKIPTEWSPVRTNNSGDNVPMIDSSEEHFPVLNSGPNSPPQNPPAVMTPNTKLFYAEMCRHHKEDGREQHGTKQHGTAMQQQNRELDSYQKLSWRLQLTPSQLASGYEMQLLADAEREGRTTPSSCIVAPFPLSMAEEDPIEKRLEETKELAKLCAAEEGVSIVDWVRQQKAEMKRYRGGLNDKAMSTVLGRTILMDSGAALLEALELPWMESVALVDQIYGGRGEKRPPEMVGKAILERIGEPVVKGMALEDEHLALFFPCLQTWQVWEFSSWEGAPCPSVLKVNTSVEVKNTIK